MKVEQAQFEALMFKFPRGSKESSVDWFDRLMAQAWNDDKPRLPYRDPGEEG